MVPLNILKEDMRLWNSSNVTENMSYYLHNYYDYYYEHYEEETTFFIIFNSIRSIQAVFAIIANVMTLIVLGELKYLTNGHVVMVYLAIFDILVGFYYALEGFMSIANRLSHEIPNWNKLCIVRGIYCYNSGRM